MSATITYKPGPYCVDHRSAQCKHALEQVNERTDVPHIAATIEDHGNVNLHFDLAVPLWPRQNMWEILNYKVLHDDMVGSYAVLTNMDRSFHPFLEGVRKLLPGEGVADLAGAILQQFEDIVELDGADPGRGCKSERHTFKYQRQLENTSGLDQLAPHLFAIRARSMCAFCWADMYGTEARRVAGDGLTMEEVAGDWDDLLPDDSMGKRSGGGSVSPTRKSMTFPKSFTPMVTPSKPDDDHLDLPF